MPELYTLQKSVKNPNKDNLRQSPRLLSYNQGPPKATRNSYKQKTEIYYVPENQDTDPIYNKQPHKSPTPSISSLELPRDDPPELYYPPPPQVINRPKPQKKVYYRPLRHPQTHFVQPYVPPPPALPPPPPPPVKAISPLPARSPPIEQYSPLPATPVFAPYSPPVAGPQLFHLTGVQPYDEPPPVQQLYRSPTPPPVQQPYRSPTPPVQRYLTPAPVQKSSPPPVVSSYPATLGGPHLYHLNPVETYNEPIVASPKPVEQPYKSPSPAPVQKSSPLPVSPVNTIQPPIQDGPELYHIRLDEIPHEPIQPSPKPVEQPYKSPSPAPVQKSSPLPAAPMPIVPSPLPTVPQLYHLNVEEINDEPIQPQPIPVAQPYKSPSPAPVQKSLPPPATPVPTIQSPPPVIPELYHLNFEQIDNEPISPEPKPVEARQRTPTPTVRKPSPLSTSPVPVFRSPTPQKPELYHLQVEQISIPPTPEEPPYRSPTPPVVKSRRPSPVPSNRVSPMPSEKSLPQGPIIYHLQPRDNLSIRSPTPPPQQRTPTPLRERTPTPPRHRSPSLRRHRTAAPLTLPPQKQAPVRNYIPTREPSFSDALHDVVTADRLVPLSLSKASDSILRSMNKFRFNGS